MQCLAVETLAANTFNKILYSVHWRFVFVTNTDSKRNSGHVLYIT